ncbi:uncharacterized protein FTJAE_197 [Fusarium tjaetaba]|uniref:Uncharacterized protein n=1 Tax=Fusarium tjaetaba TaxID=1567544 RepID=A0A8H5WA90_9HYPO|nr:uncharacterized protein FTJAE_197 [Fusarium tjaetaba]KAF5651020.1 hypothetical protein FTJAE_197 [Fusarium tjaetaba]
MTSPGASSPDTIVFDGNGDLWLTPQELCNTCVLTNKYDMTKTLQPMATSWYQRLKIMCQRSKKMQAYSKNLFVAWELGCQGAVEEMLQDIAGKWHVDEFVSLLIVRNTRLINLETFRLIPLIDPVAQHRVKMLQVFNAGGKEIAIEILAKRPLCWHTGPCSAVNLADDIPEKFIQATQYLGIDCFFIPSLNADQIRYRGSVSRLHRLFKVVEKPTFGEHRPHYCRHMEVLVGQACKIEMTALMGSDYKAIREDEGSEDDESSVFRSLLVDARH